MTLTRLVGNGFALLACVGTAACDLCGNDIAVELPSNDGKLKAVLFNRDCGATTDFSSQISILRAEESLSGGGNAFVADGDHGHLAKVQTGAWGGPDVSMRWTSPTSLAVRYPLGSRVFKNEDKVRGVAITYEAVFIP